MTRATTPGHVAPAFEPNSWYNALLVERVADRARFEARYSTPTRAAVAAYELAKAKAQQAAQRTDAREVAS